MADNEAAVDEGGTTVDTDNQGIATSRTEAGSEVNPGLRSSNTILESAEGDEEAFTMPERFLVNGEVDTEKLGKSYVELEKKLKSTRVPSAPQTPDEYTYEFPEGFNIDEEATADFRKAAHEQKFSQEQYEFLMNEYFNVVQQSTPTVAQAESSLKETWGEEFDDNLEGARKAWEVFGKDLDINVVGNNAVALQVLARVGKQMAEDKVDIPGASVEPKMTEAEINDLMNRPDYWTNKEIQAQVLKAMGQRRKG